MPGNSPEPAVRKGRIDKWLWHARFFKTRTLASEVVAAGHARINRQPIRKPSQSVTPGDVLTFRQWDVVRVIEILALADRRGPASEAQTLYKDLAPPQPRSKTDDPAPTALREDGAGRPTKKERRDTDRLRGQ